MNLKVARKEGSRGRRSERAAGIVEEGQTLVCCLNDARVGGRVEVQNFVQVFGFWHE